MRRAGPKAQTVIRGSTGLKVYLLDKANVIADFMENQFVVRDLCDHDHE
jgi:hypothetical protein